MADDKKKESDKDSQAENKKIAIRLEQYNKQSNKKEDER